MKISSVTFYIIIALVSFLILSGVQFFLVYNTYELKNEHYNLSEKKIINNDYAQSISNDKVFPGGSAIIDKHIYDNMTKLEQLYRQNPDAFNLFKQKLCLAIFKDLHRANNFDSLLAVIKKRHRLTNTFTYALTINLLDVAFESNKYIPLLETSGNNTESTDGIVIGGDLKDISLQNQVTGLTISSPMAHSYRISFMLYADTNNRKAAILTQMMPTFALSVFSISFVIFLFFVTFKKWIQQKKISEMKSDFINSINHELNTPLAAIIVANRNLQNEKMTNSKENIHSLTDVIARQAERLKMLINQVIDITRDNTIQLDQKPYSIHLLLDEIISDYQLKLNDPCIKLSLKTQATYDNISLDRFWFTTMLLNIFDNAIKYNNCNLKEITVITKNNKKGLQLIIEDNGIGMNNETKKQAFEKFYRNPGPLSYTKGLGLGLYYVKLAVESHHWNILIESEPGTGSKIIINIPF
jgi:two-component system phosphate regulon sensor histidine kinase PhoR